MVTPAAAQGAKIDVARRPRISLLLVIALAGCAAAAFSVVSALSSDYLSEPGVRAAFAVWVILSYIFAGLIAWWHRPENRFGPLMIAAGFGTFLSLLGWSNVDVLHTIGQTLNFLPPILFLHVFLAFPSGRLERSAERVIVAAAYVTGIGLGFVRMLLGGFGPDSVFNLTTAPEAADVLERIQLVTSGALALAEIGVLLARRRRGVGRCAAGWRSSPTRLPSGFDDRRPCPTGGHWGTGIRDDPTAYLLHLGLAPFAFLIGLLHTRLARSNVGDLFVELRADPGPADLRDALARALRDPSLTLAYWLPKFGSWTDLDGRPVELPRGAGERRR